MCKHAGHHHIISCVKPCTLPLLALEAVPEQPIVKAQKIQPHKAYNRARSALQNLVDSDPTIELLCFFGVKKTPESSEASRKPGVLKLNSALMGFIADFSCISLY